MLRNTSIFWHLNAFCRFLLILNAPVNQWFLLVLHVGLQFFSQIWKWNPGFHMRISRIWYRSLSLTMHQPTAIPTFLGTSPISDTVGLFRWSWWMASRETGPVGFYEKWDGGMVVGSLLKCFFSSVSLDFLIGQLCDFISMGCFFSVSRKLLWLVANPTLAMAIKATCWGL